jgi:hypothetical protein
MSRTATTIALVLALLTGLALATVTQFVMGTNSAPGGALAIDRIERVRALYDGLNNYLATGDDNLEHMLAPDFRDVSSLGAEPGTTKTLLARLDSLRQSANPPRFSIVDVRDLGELVAVRVSLEFPTTLEVAGLAVTTNVPPVMTEFVQFDRDAIVARWSRDDVAPRIDKSIETSIVLPVSSALIVDIDQVTLAPGSTVELAAGTPFAVLLKSGTVRVTTDAGHLYLTTGDDRWVDASGGAQLSNEGNAPAEFWVAPIGAVSIQPGLIYGLIDPTDDPGVAIQRLVWSTRQIDPDPTTLHLHIALVTLPPGAEFETHPALLGESVAVLDGSPDVTVAQGAARHCQADASVIQIDRSATIAAGEGVSPNPDSVVSYRVASDTPATLLVLAIVSTKVNKIG